MPVGTILACTFSSSITPSVRTSKQEIALDRSLSELRWYCTEQHILWLWRRGDFSCRSCICFGAPSLRHMKRSTCRTVEVNPWLNAKLCIQQLDINSGVQYNCTGILCVTCEYMSMVDHCHDERASSIIIWCRRVELNDTSPSSPPAASFSVAQVNLNRILIRKTEIYCHPHGHLGICSKS